MFLSRFCSTILLVNRTRLSSTTVRSSFSHVSPAISSEENNEWLWSYLRNRKTFEELNEEQRRRVIEIELQTLRESGERVPDVIPEERWKELINLVAIEKRKSLYGYLFLRETYRKRRLANSALNESRRIEAANRRATLLSEGKQPTNYPGYSSIFRHIRRQSEKQLREHALLTQARLGENIVIDCGFEKDHARDYHLLNLVDQVQYLFAEIHRYHSPSFVYLCNLSNEGKLKAEFDRRAPLEYLCYEATQSSYLDLFPREKLIYLSPDSNVEMTEFDHDAVYIIGGIIDLSEKKPLTFGKAKRENIRHQRFPIDRYVKFGGGSGKTLTLDQVYNILMTLKHTGSWMDAFQFIPQRKVIERYPSKVESKHHSYEQFGRWTGLNTKN